MGEDTQVFVGIDVAKLRNAVAIAEPGRDGEVRYFGEVDASEASMRQCKLNDVEPFGYLRTTLEAIAQGHPMKRLDELLPGPFATKSMH